MEKGRGYSEALQYYIIHQRYSHAVNSVNRYQHLNPIAYIRVIAMTASILSFVSRHISSRFTIYSDVKASEYLVNLEVYRVHKPSFTSIYS